MSVKSRIIRLIIAASLSHLLLSYSPLSIGAAVFKPGQRPPRTIAPFVLKNSDLEKGNTKAYRPWFENGAWQGDLIQYNITITNDTITLSTGVNVGEFPPSMPASNWSARASFAAALTADENYWDSGRKIITSTTGTDQIPFRWNDSNDGGEEISDSQKMELAGPSVDVTTQQNDILDFIRGDDSREGMGFRDRSSILGDIINANPVLVSAPQAVFTLPGFSAFKNANKNRAERIYVQANDGMVHAFDTANGSEVYAYVPSMLFPQLSRLTRVPYDHTFLADGQLTSADANITVNSVTAWKTLLAGGLGAGAKGLFVLDITNPNLTAETAFSDVSAGDDKKVLFEIHADRDGDPNTAGDNDDDLGYIHGNTAIALLPDNKWYVVSGNGYGSTNGMAKLYLVELNSPYSVTTIETDNTITDNGLSAPVLVDKDNDFKVDYAYAGDLKGNLWKFDLSDLTKPAIKLFSSGIDQPITVFPEVGIHPTRTNDGDKTFIVYVGSGSLLSRDLDSDLDNTMQQSIYGIWDDPDRTAPGNPQDPFVANTCQEVGTPGDLLCQTLTEVTFQSSIPVGIEKKVRIVTQQEINWANDEHEGWKVDLPTPGERLLGHPQLRGGRLQFVTTNPTVTRVDSWLMELDFENGGDPGKVLFDLNENLVLDQNTLDKVEVSGNFRIPVAINMGPGVFSQPTIARVSEAVDTLFINGLLLNFVPKCSGSCEGGLLGGHIDVETDITLGDEVTGHTDDYDGKNDTTVADYFNLVTDDPDIGTQTAIENAVNSSQEFIVVIANAELSTGATLVIGDKMWNVVDYQREIQRKIKTWEDDPSKALSSDELVFTLNEIMPTGGLKIVLENSTILTGGLLSSAPQCVTDPPNVEFSRGHWRGGALTLQLLKFENVRDSVGLPDEDQRAYLRQTVTDLQDGPYSIPGGEIVLKEDTNGDGDFDDPEDISYAGIIANKNFFIGINGFLYESTVFWHLGSSECYGSALWQSVRDAALLSGTEIAELISTQSQLLNEIANFTCPEGVCTTDNQNYLALLEELVSALASLISDYQGDDLLELAAFIADGGLGILAGDSGVNEAAPVNPEDPPNFPPVVNPTLGTSFVPGRQSWMEISLSAL